MKKIILLIVLLICLSSCGLKEDKNDYKYSFVDDINEIVNIKTNDRVACLLGSFADIWITAGGKIVATNEDGFDEFDLDLDDDVINLGTTDSLSLELLLSSKPDLVIASAKMEKHLELKEVLNNAGIAVAYFDVTTFDDYLRVLNIFTDLTGNKDNYQKYGLDLKNGIDEIIKNSNYTYKVLVCRASATYLRAKKSDSTVLGGMLKEMGCINIADNDDSLLENLSIEKILVEDPDYIFFIEVGDTKGIKENIENSFKENPLWLNLKAIKENKYFIMEKNLYNLKPNKYWLVAYEKLEEILQK